MEENLEIELCILRLEDYMTKNEGAEITEDDLLEEPDVSLGEESQENVST